MLTDAQTTIATIPQPTEEVVETNPDIVSPTLPGDILPTVDTSTGTENILDEEDILTQTGEISTEDSTSSEDIPL